MSQSAADANAITTQPLISPMNIENMENNPNTSVSQDKAASIITTQPLMNDPTDEEQEKKKEQEKDQVTEAIEDCTWCCFATADFLPNCECPSCDNCCDNDCGDCCTGCCDDGPSADVDIDGNDCASCLECCGACLECCSSD